MKIEGQNTTSKNVVSSTTLFTLLITTCSALIVILLALTAMFTYSLLTVPFDEEHATSPMNAGTATWVTALTLIGFLIILRNTQKYPTNQSSVSSSSAIRTWMLWSPTYGLALGAAYGFFPLVVAGPSIGAVVGLVLGVPAGVVCALLYNGTRQTMAMEHQARKYKCLSPWTTSAFGLAIGIISGPFMIPFSNFGGPLLVAGYIPACWVAGGLVGCRIVRTNR